LLPLASMQTESVKSGRCCKGSCGFLPEVIRYIEAFEKMVIFEVCSYLFEFKEGDSPEADQPEEYIEYFED